jgi:flagellar hook-associated protein 2
LSTDSLSTLAHKINSLSGTLSAAVVEENVNGEARYRLEVTGAGELAFEDESNILEALGFLTAEFARENQAGADAVLEINGLRITRSSNTISDALDGIALELWDARPGEEVLVSVTKDVEATRSGIQEFIKAFNNIQDFLNKHAGYDAETQSAGVLLGDFTARQVEWKLSEIRNQRVAALPSTSLRELNEGAGVAKGSIQITDRAGNTAVIDLSDARTVQDVLDAINATEGIEITATVNSSMKGLKLTDSSGGEGLITVTEVDSSTAADLGLLGSVDFVTLVGSDIGTGGSYSLSEIGITSDESGRLTLDESTFSQALEENYAAVEALFSTADFGIAYKADSISDFLTDPVTGVLKSKQDTLQATIGDMEDQIDRLERRISRREENLVRQFAALEATLSQYQAMSDYLSQQLAIVQNNWTSGNS